MNKETGEVNEIEMTLIKTRATSRVPPMKVRGSATGIQRRPSD